MSNIKPSVVDGFEKESFVLLEYVNDLHSKLHQQEYDFKQKESQILDERKAIEQELGLALKCAKLQKSRLQRENDKFVEESDAAIRSLRNHLDSSSSSLIKEQQKAQELENTVADLKQQLERHEQLRSRRIASDEREKSRLEKELNALQKKIDLGWIVGSLQDVYLRSDEAGEGDCQRSKALDEEMRGLERQIRRLIDSVVQSPKAGHADATEGGDFDSDSESGRDEELEGTARKYVEHNVEGFCEIRRG